MKILVLISLAAFWVTGCVTGYDYTNLRAARPHSILVLPPENETTAVEATYGCLSTVSRPLAEMGYYVYPVGVVDLVMKNNGLATAGEMRAVPIEKLREVFGADAVLYFTVHEYGARHLIIAGSTRVSLSGHLVDTRTGTVLWEGSGLGEEQSGTGTILDIILVPIDTALANATDRAHGVSGIAMRRMITQPYRGLLYGPYHPESGQGPSASCF